MHLTGKLRHINVCSALKRLVRDKKLRPEIQVSAVASTSVPGYSHCYQKL